MRCPRFLDAEDYRDHLPCTGCEPKRKTVPGPPPPLPLSVRGLKHDEGKVPLDLLPTGALAEVARVLEHGATKYGRNSWQHVTPFRSRYTAALLRHLFARARGETRDPESGLLHMAHAACNVLFLLSGEVGHDPVDSEVDA